MRLDANHGSAFERPRGRHGVTFVNCGGDPRAAAGLGSRHSGGAYCSPPRGRGVERRVARGALGGQEAPPAIGAGGDDENGAPNAGVEGDCESTALNEWRLHAPAPGLLPGEGGSEGAGGAGRESLGTAGGWPLFHWGGGSAGEAAAANGPLEGLPPRPFRWRP